jgi:putative hydrolase of the HAD superfamily
LKTGLSLKFRTWFSPVVCMVKAILFDLGGTLFDLAPVNKIDMFRAGARRTYEYLRVRGYDLPSFSWYFRSAFAIVLWSYFWQKMRGSEFRSLPAIERRCWRLNIFPDKEMLNDLGWEAYAPQVGYTIIEPELLDTLDLLRGRGVKLGIVSNTFVPAHALDRHLEMIGLLPYFPVRVYSGELGCRKPGQRIFRIALDQIEAIPEETVFVGDRISTDMIGARRAGMMTVFKSPARPARLHHSIDHVIERVAQLPEALTTLRPVVSLAHEPQPSTPELQQA